MLSLLVSLAMAGTITQKGDAVLDLGYKEPILAATGRVLVPGVADYPPPFGGNRIDAYNANTDVWSAYYLSDVTHQPVSLVEMADSNILVMGYIWPTPYTYELAAWILDPFIPRFTPAASPTPDFEFSTSSGLTLMNDGRILVTGGIRGQSSEDRYMVYTPWTDSWVTGTMPVALYGHVPVVVGDNVYMMDGSVRVFYGPFHVPPSEIFPHTRVDWYNTPSGTWNSNPYPGEATLERSNGGAAYLGGGLTATFGDDVSGFSEVYHIPSDTWTLMGPPNALNVPRWGFGWTTMPGGAMVVGGYTSFGGPNVRTGTVELWTPTGGWALEVDQILPSHGSSAVVVPNLCPGGVTGVHDCWLEST